MARLPKAVGGTYAQAWYLLQRARSLWERYQDLSPRERRRLKDQAHEVRDCTNDLRRARGREARLAAMRELGTALAELRRRLPPPPRRR